MTRVYIHTFGCKANQYDSEVLRQALEGAGAVIVDNPGDANAAIVNSCTVTHVSEAKMRTFVRRIARLNPDCTNIIVVGCAATLDDGTIESIKSVSSVIGGTNPEPVLRALGMPVADAERVLHSFARGTRAWLKIQDGCDERCTYCATTLARGRSVSRPIAEITEEAELLASNHSEIVLTGVHIGNYGKDLSAPRTLGNLVHYLVERIPGVRFRLSSIEATQIDSEIVDLMAGASNRLAPHIHAPLQSGSDRLLKRMGRPWYTAVEYRSRLELVAGKLNTMGLGADVIVGFPGETDEDFAATRSIVEELPFTYLHVFPYSPRRGTPARQLGPPVEAVIVKERSVCLRELAAAKRSAYHVVRDGSFADVVLLGRSGGRSEGLTEDYLTVFSMTDGALPGRFPAILQLRDAVLWAEPLGS